jgi:hypothetical protein
MRWEGHIALMGEKRDIYSVMVENPEGKGPLGRPRHRWEIILRWIFRKLVLGHGMGYSDSGLGQMAGTCESGKELSGSIKYGEFLDWLRTC